MLTGNTKDLLMVIFFNHGYRKEEKTSYGVFILAMLIGSIKELLFIIWGWGNSSVWLRHWVGDLRRGVRIQSLL